MVNSRFENLIDCAVKVANYPEHFNHVSVQDIDDECHINIKLDDAAWPYKANCIDLKTANLIDNFGKDLANLFNLTFASKFTPQDIEKEFNSQLKFNYNHGCLELSADLTGPVITMLHTYSKILKSDSDKWKCAISGSLFAYSMIMRGCSEWYSLTKLHTLKKEFIDDENILRSLNYAHKILMGSRRTPDFLAKTLSAEGTVSINKETPKTATQLRSFKYIGSNIETFYVDDLFRLTAFAANSVKTKLGHKVRSLSLQSLDAKDRAEIATLAQKMVQTKKPIPKQLQVSVKFKGTEYQSAKIDGFGPQRDGAVSADELFNNPLYSLPIEIKPTKQKQKFKDLPLLNF